MSLSIALEPLHQRESKDTDLLSYMKDNLFVMLIIGKLTISINKNIQKAIKWFENIKKSILILKILRYICIYYISKQNALLIIQKIQTIYTI